MFIKADKQQRIQAQNVKKPKVGEDATAPLFSLFFLFFFSITRHVLILRQYKLYFPSVLIKTHDLGRHDALLL